MVPNAVVMVMVELLPELTVDGENDTRAPDGAPVVLKPIDCVTPEVTAVLMAVEAALPATTLAEVGEAEIEKSLLGGVVTVRGNVVVWVAEDPVPFTVTV